MAKACGGPGRGRQPWAVQCGAGTGRDPPHSISAKGLPLQRLWLRFPGQQPHLGRINRGGALKKREGMLLVDPPCSEGWVLLPASQEGVAHRNALGRARAVAPGGGATGRGTRSPGPSDVALQAGRGWETAGIWERGGAPPRPGKGRAPTDPGGWRREWSLTRSGLCLGALQELRALTWSLRAQPLWLPLQARDGPVSLLAGSRGGPSHCGDCSWPGRDSQDPSPGRRRPRASCSLGMVGSLLPPEESTSEEEVES